MHIAFLPAHTLTVTSIPGGKHLDWTHPADCPEPENTCEFVRRIHRMGHDMADLAEGRPDGVYRLGGFGFHGLGLVDEDGNMLPDVPAAAGAGVIHRPAPNGCRWCGIERRSHFQQWSSRSLDVEMDPDEARTLTDLPGFLVYQDGRIQGPSGKILTPQANAQGYMTFSGPRRRPRNQRRYRVHVVVCRAFHGEKPSPVHGVRHLNGDQTYNAAWNLAWGTADQNAADRNLHGHTLYGLNNPAGRLSDAQVGDIKALYTTGKLTQKEIGDTFGVSRSLVGQIVRGEIHQPRIVGWHQWQQPTQKQIKARMLARRAARDT